MDRLKALGAYTIRADEVYRGLLANDADMLSELRERFSEAFTQTDGAFDRVAMRRIAFSNPGKLADLNRITHPYVLREIRRETARAFMRGGSTPVAVEAIALIGSSLEMLCTLKIAVIAPFNVRVERAMSRDGMSRKDAEARRKSQKNDDYYITNCNIAIDNNDTLEVLSEKVTLLWETHIRHDKNPR
jgi:dephospho-CoA kinase